MKKHISNLIGIHGDLDSYKLLESFNSEIYQIVEDTSVNYQTFLCDERFILNHLKPIMILMAEGFGNVFPFFSDYALYNYKLTCDSNYNDHDKHFTSKWNVKNIFINWLIKVKIIFT